MSDNVYLNWVRETYGHEKYLEYAAALCYDESVELDKNRSEYQSPASKETVGAYLGLVNHYPESLGNLGPTCTPSRAAASQRVWSQEIKRRMVQRRNGVGH